MDNFALFASIAILCIVFAMCSIRVGGKLVSDLLKSMMVVMMVMMVMIIALLFILLSFFMLIVLLVVVEIKVMW